MAKRSYEQNCALARTCDIIGERWSLLLIRDLLVGPRRFKDLMQSLRGIGTNLLASRLKQLQAARIVQRDGDGTYSLTDRGRALEPAVLSLVRWGLQELPSKSATVHHRDEWDLVALKACFRPQRSRKQRISVQYATEQFKAWTTINEADFKMGLGELCEPDVTVRGSIQDLFSDAVAPGTLVAKGCSRKLKNYMAMFAIGNT